MKKEDKELRIMQIAATILYKCCGNVRIEKVESNYWDLVVLCLDYNFSFAVAVKSSTFVKNQAYQDYLHKYSLLLLSASNQYRLPLLLMSVNESTESALVSQVFVESRHMYVVNDKPVRRTLTKDTWPQIFENLRSLYNTPSFMSPDCWKIKKTIKLIASDDITSEAYVIYFKDFTPLYRMHTKDAKDNIDELSRFIKGIPEDEYPTDDLDKAILDAIKEKYPRLQVQSNTMLLNSELKELADLCKNNEHSEFKLVVAPNLINSSDEVKLLFERQPVVEITLPVLIFSKEYDLEYAFETFYHYVSPNTWFESYLKYNELLKTFHSPIEFIP